MPTARVLATVAVVFLASSCGRDPTSAPLAPPHIEILDFNHYFAVDLGAMVQLTPMLEDSLGNTLSMPPGLTLVSRDTTIVSVDNRTFVLQSLAEGETRVVGSVNWNGRVIADSVSVSVQCSEELIVQLTPPADTLAVGQSFTPKIDVYSCGGHLHPTDTWTWRAADTTIVRVDSVSGLTTGLRAGSTNVRPTGVRLGTETAVGVTVIAAPSTSANIQHARQ